MRTGLVPGKSVFLIPGRKNPAGLKSNQKDECYSPFRLWKTNPARFYALSASIVTHSSSIFSINFMLQYIENLTLLIAWAACWSVGLRLLWFLLLARSIDQKHIPASCSSTYPPVGLHPFPGWPSLSRNGRFGWDSCLAIGILECKANKKLLISTNIGCYLVFLVHN